jgi:hypothetical protein
MSKREPSRQMEALRHRGAGLLASWGTLGADPVYLAKWARNLARAVSRGELERLRAEYAARGRDKRLSKADRQVNRQRATAPEFLKFLGSIGRLRSLDAVRLAPPQHPVGLFLKFRTGCSTPLAAG